MKAQMVGRAIGAASFVFGIFDIMMSRKFGRAIGAGEKMGGRVFQIAGAREVATGLAGLIMPASPKPVQWRLAGDVVDLATLAYIAAPANPRRNMALLALGIVAGVTAIDYLGARAIARKTKARQPGQ